MTIYERIAAAHQGHVAGHRIALEMQRRFHPNGSDD